MAVYGPFKQFLGTVIKTEELTQMAKDILYANPADAFKRIVEIISAVGVSSQGKLKFDGISSLSDDELQEIYNIANNQVELSGLKIMYVHSSNEVGNVEESAQIDMFKTHAVGLLNTYYMARIDREVCGDSYQAQYESATKACLIAMAAFENEFKTLNILSSYCRELNDKWWRDPRTGEPIKRNKGELICLMHSELSEAMEGERKNLMDSHLLHRKQAEVELADALIRIFDYAGGFGYDLGGAVREKLAYNMQRADHKPENRLKEGGKKF